ncbi:DegQ family serine endoprotease [Limisalsivibrio acetivorans]|uniref:DegQ family serine endoprotease n=1 Tax=Limisalsivibrio acetivorans TaxID=1304888 RepID=UPI0003B6FA5F|nr:DegQ family serine endoprotease [Limisalsivibrio acetivorans]
MRKKTNVILAVMIIFAASAVSAFQMAPDSFSEVVKNTKSGVVNISTTKIVKRKTPDMFQDEFFRRFFGDQLPGQGNGGEREYKSSSLGSGFVIDKEGLIVTNNHVVEGADEIIVKLNDEHEFEAEVIGKDPLTDLALISIDPKGVELSPLKLANSDDSEIGDWVIAIGNPLGLEWTVTAGIISAKGRALGSGPYDNFMQTDASINPGNSGGPLLNIKGEVVGINTAIIPSGQGLGFAIPVNMMKELLPKLKTGKVERGWLGVSVQPLDEKLAEGLGLENDEGALIADVVEGDPAEKAGIRAGDVVIAIDGKKIASNRELINTIGAYDPGKTVEVTVVRDGKEMDIDVTLGTRGDDSASAPEKPSEDAPIIVTELNDEMMQRFNISGGVLVKDVDQKSNAYEAGLRNGDIILWINRESVNSPSSFYGKFKKVEKGDVVFLKVLSRGNGKFIAFDKE